MKGVSFSLSSSKNSSKKTSTLKPTQEFKSDEKTPTQLDKEFLTEFDPSKSLISRSKTLVIPPKPNEVPKPTQLKRLELKLKQFAEVETMLMKECEQVERVKQRMATERALTFAAQFGLVQNNAGNTRQQVVPPSQPFISGYGNNQPISSINPSSSASANVNTPRAMLRSGLD